MYSDKFGEYERFDLYIALWHFCTLYHSGIGSRGYRILGRLYTAGLRIGPMARTGDFTGDPVPGMIFNYLVREYADSI